MTKPPIDYTRPVQTRDGRAVTIYTTSAPGMWPVHGYIAGDPGPSGWTLINESLTNAPEEVEVDVLMYVNRDYSGQVWLSPVKVSDVIGRRRIKFTHIVGSEDK